MARVTLEQFIQIQNELTKLQLGIAPGSTQTSAQPTPPSLIGGPLRRGALSTAADFASAGSLGASALGFDDLATGLQEKSDEFAQARDAIPRRVARVEDIKGAKDLGVFALETLVENAPMLASIAVPGGVAAKGAQLLGASARAASATGLVAGFMADVGLQTGESANIAREAGKDPGDVRVIGSGIGKGALDFIPLLTIAKRIGLLKNIPLGPFIEREISKRLVEGGFISRAVGEVGTIVAREVPTEVAQEVINIALDRSLRQFEGQLTDEEKSQMLNAAAGAAAFGMLGIPAAIFSPAASRQQAIREATEDELINPEVSSAPAQSGPFLLEGPPGSTEPGEDVMLVSPQGQAIPYNLRDEYKQRTATSQLELAGTSGTADIPASTFSYDSNGRATLNFGPDALEVAADEIVSVSPVDRSEVDNAILAIEGARQQDRQRATKEQVRDVEATERPSAVPASVQKLLTMRDEILADPDMRRKRDGELTAKAKKRVETLEQKVSALSKKLGVENPLAVVELEDSTDIETDLQDVNKRQEERQTVEGDRLSAGERAILDKLTEKEVFEGLTDAEYSTMERLLARARGEISAERERRTPEQIRRERKELEAVAQEELDAESEKVRKSDKIIDITKVLRARRQQRVKQEIQKGRRELEQQEAEAERLNAIVRRELRAMKEEARGYRRLFEWTSAPSYELYDAANGEIVAFYGGQELDTALVAVRFVDGRFQASLPGKNGGDVGPLFDSLAEAENYAEGLIEDVRTSIKTVASGRTSTQYSVGQVSDMVQKIIDRFPNAPEVVVMANTNGLRGIPSLARNAATLDPYTTAGSFFLDDPERVYIYSDNVRSEEDLMHTLLHESFHRGLHSLMTGKEIRQLLDLVARSKPEVFDAITERYPELMAAALNGDSTAKQRLNRQVLIEAEEFIARMAESNPQDSLFQKIVAFIRRIVRRLFPGLKISDTELNVLIGNVGAYRRKGTSVTPRNLRTVRDYMYNSTFLRETGRTGDIVENVIPGIESTARVWGQKYLNGVLTPLQIARRTSRDPHLRPIAPSVERYLELVQRWWARKRTLTIDAVSITEDWSKFSKRDSERIAKVMFQVQDESARVGRKLEPQEVKKIMQQNGLDPERAPSRGGRNIYQLWKDLDDSFVKVVDQMQAGLERAALLQATRDVAQTNALLELWRSDPTRRKFAEAVSKGQFKNLELGARLAKIEQETNRLRNFNYFPLMRFGQWAITIRAKNDTIEDGREIAAGEIVAFETHSTVGEGRARAEEVAKSKYGDTSKYSVELSKLADNEFAFLGMPPALFETLQDKLGLDDAQKERLKELYFKFSPGRSFLRHLVKREGIAGFSTDAMRVYASYMMNAANHLARVEFHQEMENELSDMRKGARDASDSRRAGVLRDYFQDHFNYLMNPTNDWARIRALGFLWYLGFNVKSALVNLTQIPMVAYPFLSAHYGETAAFGAIAKAYKEAGKIASGRKIADADIDRDLTRAMSEGFIDEALATELAGIAEGDILNVMAPEGASARIINRVSYYGAFLFRKAEKFNRITTFLAARDLARQRGLKGEELYKAARDAVQTTMFEYAKWNRPQFMRGRKSVFFLFWQYMQHLAFLAYGGEGSKVAVRTWLMLMAAAGAQGLPFAENFFDIFDWGATEVKEFLGVPDPRTAVREDMRAMVGTIIDKPDLVMHGLGRYYGMGPLHFMQLFDVPIPNVDISGSLGTGEIIPGLSEAFRAEPDPDKKMGRVLIDTLGPVIGVGYNLWRSLADDNPDSWKRWERAMPTAMQSVSKSFRREERGEESFRGGGAVVKFEPQNAEHRAENIAQALGFSPTRLNQRQELRFSQEQLRQYWTTRRAMLMESYAYAILGDDSEAMDRALKKIREFNEVVPARQLGIQADNLRESVKQRYRRRYLREAGIPNERAFVPLYHRIEQLYPEGADAAPR